MRPHIVRNSLAWLFLICLAPQVAAEIRSAAKVEFISGTATAVSRGREPRHLKLGDVVLTGDRITTASDSAVKLRFADQTRFDIGANADMRVEKFQYKPKSTQNSFRTRVFKGTFRFVTGLIARFRPKGVQVAVPVATIGVRGTNVVAEVDATSATIILLENEDDPSKPTAIEVANQFGSTVVDQHGYGTEIPDEHSPPSPQRRMQVRTIDNMTRSFRSLNRIRAPRMHR